MIKIKSVLDYLGSKVKLAPVIAGAIEQHVGVVDGALFADIFAGTGAISRWFLHNRNLKSITTNDFELYSAAVCMATMKQIDVPAELYNLLNTIQGCHGFITENCSPAGHVIRRRFFTPDNARRIDGVRFHINNMQKKGYLTMDQMIKLSGELVIAADKVSNTASVYGAYLKQFKQTALKDMVIKSQTPNVNPDTTKVWNLMLDANDAIIQLRGDILYIDPPYNARQYGNNYHVLNYIADFESESNYEPVGITGVHRDWKRSKYCNKKKVGEQLNHLISSADFEYIIFSYNNRGILPLIELKEIFSRYTEILEIKQIEYKNFKADRNRTYDADRTTEYIIIMKKSRRRV